MIRGPATARFAPLIISADPAIVTRDATRYRTVSAFPVGRVTRRAVVVEDHDIPNAVLMIRQRPTNVVGRAGRLIGPGIHRLVGQQLIGRRAPEVAMGQIAGLQTVVCRDRRIALQG